MQKKDAHLEIHKDLISMKNISNNLAAIIIFVLALVIYWTTSYPSITWWDSSEYSAAAVCLGLTGAPGSILLTFFGWLLSKLTTHNPAFLFNLFAGLIASLTVVCSFLTFKKILSMIAEKDQNKFTFVEDLSLVITSGIIICSTTLWEYAIMFTPYILTALFTVLILLSVLEWWRKADERDSWKNLFLITLLLGMDFSVHRTNAVLIPGILIIMILRNPKIFLNYRSYLSAILGIIIGLSIQFLYIPMSLNDPAFNMGETNSLSRLWDFISLKQYGGNFLMDIFVRKGPLWTYQIPYYLNGFANNFFYLNHSTILFGFVPGFLGIIGVGYLFKSDRKIAIALATFFIITIAASIIQFNLPENYFRPIYRHYLPTYIIFSVFVFLGTFYVASALTRINKKRKWISISIVIFLLMCACVTQYITNLKYRNGSKQTFTVDYATNLINSIDKHGIVFSYGDNQYFPELYLQIGEKLRPDIIHCNLSLLNIDWYVTQNQRHDKDFPYKGEGIDISKIGHKDWVTESSSIPISDSVKLKCASRINTIHLSLPALRQNNSNSTSDVVLFDILKNDKWKRPIYFFKLGIDSGLYNWLKPYLSDEGLVFQFVPDTSMHINTTAIETNLKKFRIEGFNNNSITIDDVSKEWAEQYYDMFLIISKHKAEMRDWKGATQYLKHMKDLLPFDRLQPSEEVINETKEVEELIKTDTR